jgi:hypothetical protein
LLLTNFYDVIIQYLEANSDRSILALDILNSPLVISYNDYLYDINKQIKFSSISIPRVFNTYTHLNSVFDALVAYGFKNEVLIDEYKLMMDVYPIQTEILLDISPVPVTTSLNELNNSFSASEHAQKWMVKYRSVSQLDDLSMGRINYTLEKYYLARCKSYYIKTVYM